MRQSIILINAALIIARMVFTLMNERGQEEQSSGRRSLMDSSSGILLEDRPNRWRRRAGASAQGISNDHGTAMNNDKTVAVAGDYAYVNTGSSLIIYGISNKRNPTKVSETFFN